MTLPAAAAEDDVALQDLVVELQDRGSHVAVGEVRAERGEAVSGLPERHLLHRVVAAGVGGHRRDDLNRGALTVSEEVVQVDLVVRNRRHAVRLEHRAGDRADRLQHDGGVHGLTGLDDVHRRRAAGSELIADRDDVAMTDRHVGQHEVSAAVGRREAETAADARAGDRRTAAIDDRAVDRAEPLREQQVGVDGAVRREA